MTRFDTKENVMKNKKEASYSLTQLTKLTEEELQEVSGGGKKFGDFLNQWWQMIFRRDDR
ncbi:MAG: bacteriocin [Candidatus Saccharibacteria bacterium]|nr:bacteriocin [Candidatus Saccharibacteria bacterium]